jgi:hypothetical protein
MSEPYLLLELVLRQPCWVVKAMEDGGSYSSSLGNYGHLKVILIVGVIIRGAADINTGLA